MASEVGRGGRGGKKRYNSQPMEGANKDSRHEEEQDEDLSWSTVVNGRRTAPTTTSNTFAILTQPNSYPDRTMRSSSVASRGTQGSRGRGRGQPYQTSSARADEQLTDQDQAGRRTDRGDRTKFVTAPANGQMRDEFTVECQTLNDRPFKGTLTFEEARVTIFHEILGFEINSLYSMKMEFSGCPIIKFKMKQQTNIDDLISVEHFILERKAATSDRIDYIQCRVLGIRGKRTVPHYDGSENDVRWVKIEGCNHQLTEDEIKEGLLPFGELLTPIREDIYEDSDSERDIVGNGTYSVKMKLAVPVPQFLPMHGKRIRIYHSGITKLCTNCFGRHTRRQCRSNKVPWIEYVRDFMKSNTDIGESYYGKWWDIIDKEYPGYFEEQEHQSDQQYNEQREEPRLLSTQNTRFAQRRTESPKPSRDPRIQKREQRQTDQRPSLGQYSGTRDRQSEMSRLLAQGLTLTDAKKYITNREEQEEIEKRMSGNGQQNSEQYEQIQSQSIRGRGLTRSTNQQ